MRTLASMLVAGMIWLGCGRAGEIPSPAPESTPSTHEELPLPVSDENAAEAPGLLPEPDRLPSGTAPASTMNNTPSPQQAQKSPKNRFDHIRAIAMRSPHEVRLLEQANHSSSSIVRRRYLRAYYISLCTRMRKLDPDLKAEIDAYERAKMGQITSIAHSVRSSHHHSRSLSHHIRSHRSRRIMVIHEFYSPEIYPAEPIGPYGPW